MIRLFPTLLLLALAPAACGGGAADPPTIVTTSPAQGEMDVPPDTTISVTFSEPMNREEGILLLAGDQLDESILASAGVWSADGTTVTFTPPRPLPWASEVTVTVREFFRSVEGVPLAESFVFTFVVATAMPPQVVSSTPAEGETGVSALIDTIEIGFSEEMAQNGSVALSGGSGTLGVPVWGNGNTTLSIPVAGLVYDTLYHVRLTAFAGADGLPLEPGVLGDSFLDFSTGPDTDRPTVTLASPAEGQVDVARSTPIEVTFSEVMDTSIVDATLTGGPSPRTLTGTWSEGGTKITFTPLPGFEYETPYSLDLTSFADPIGNVLDGVPVLGDGMLDFVTAPYVDTIAPYVQEVMPAEGATGVVMEVGPVTIQFIEAMNTSVTEVALTNSAGTQMVSGTWSPDGRVLTLVLPPLAPGANSLAVGSAGFTDLAGNPLFAAIMLFDGNWDFDVVPNSGEDCMEPMLPLQATPTATGGREWVVAGSSITLADGAFGCDTAHGADFVVRVDKTSGTVASGGSLLHIRASNTDTLSSNRLDVQIFGGACSIMDPAAVQHECLSDRTVWSSYLDVPAGSYWVWVGRTSSGTWAGTITVTAEEVPVSATEGESCLMPYTSASPSTVYTPPADAASPHRWVIPASIESVDMSATTGGMGRISCDTGTGTAVPGVDAVVEFTPAAATSLLSVNVTSSTTLGVSVELLDNCVPTTPGTVSSYCTHNTTTHTFNPGNDGGPMYFWIATANSYDNPFPGATVDIFETVIGPGEWITTAVPITGSGPITKISDARAVSPSCFPATGAIDWYVYTPSAPTMKILTVTPDASGAIALYTAGGTMLSCATGGAPVAGFLPAGGDFYIAVETGSAIGALTIVEQAYTGVQGIASSTGVTFPATASGDTFLTTDGTSLYLGNTNQVWSVPMTGGAATSHGSAEGLTTTMLADGGDWVPGAGLFSCEDTTSTTAARVHRLWDGTSPSWAPVAWDTPSIYVANAMNTLTTDGVNLFSVTTNTSTTTGNATFYQISPTTMGSAVNLGVNTHIRSCYGIAADDEFFYVSCIQMSSASEGIFRVNRAAISDPPVVLALAPAVDLSSVYTWLGVDSLTDPNNLYFWNYGSGGGGRRLHVVVNPDGAVPIHLGSITTWGSTSDYAMTIDRSTGFIYHFDSSGITDPADTIVRVQ